jgi:hypothetical protein
MRSAVTLSCTLAMGRISEVSAPFDPSDTSQRTRSFVWTMPTTLSSESRYTGNREYGLCATMVMTSLSGVSMFSASNLRARNHQLLRLTHVQPQRAPQTPVFVRFEKAAIAALGNEQLDLLRRVDVSMCLR